MEVPERPVSVMWESTIACGLKCKHCKASARTRPDPSELTTDESFAFIDQIADLGIPLPILRITGGNALLRKDIFDIIKYSKSRGITTTIAPSTTPDLNRENIVKLQEAGCDTVAVSIDGKNAAAHDIFRGVPGTFDRLVDATNIMTDVGLPFRLLTTVSRFNVRDLVDIMMMAKDMGARGWYLYMLIPTGRATEDYEITPGEFEDVFNFIYDLMEKKPMTINAIAGSEPYRRVAVMRRLAEEGRINGGLIRTGELYDHLKGRLDQVMGDIEPSSTPSERTSSRSRDRTVGKGIFVSHTAHVYPSSFLPVSLGNVRERSLGDIYRGADILWEMQDASRLKGRCGKCEFNDICRGSRSRAYAVTGDYMAEDPYCAYEPGTVGEGDWDNASILEELRVTNYSKPRN